MTRLNTILFAGFVVFLFAVNTLYIVDQRQTALVLQFGEAVKHETEAGLKVKVPFVQNVLFFEKRIQNLHADTSEVIASDQKTMRVDAFAKYKIVDALKFYQSAKDELGFKTRLSPILNSSLRQVLGEKPFRSLLTKERSLMMKQISSIVNDQASSFGVEVLDVRIMRADLPDKSREAVYQRMRTEREKEAKEIRAEGAEHAQKIVSTADKERQILLANANKESEILRGAGDAQAIKIFADSFGKDPEFFDFYRSMQAYRKAINKDTATMLVSPDSDFMKYFNRSRAR